MTCAIERVRLVRLVVVTLRERIPDWVTLIDRPMNQVVPMRKGQELFSQKGSFLADSVINDLATSGYALTGGHFYPLSQTLCKTVFIFKSLPQGNELGDSEEEIPEEEESRLLDVENLLSGKWYVRADLNGPVGEIDEDHIVVKFQNRQGLGRNQILPKFSILDMDTSTPLPVRFVSA